jgi:hypothetical protein
VREAEVKRPGAAESVFRENFDSATMPEFVEAVQTYSPRKAETMLKKRLIVVAVLATGLGIFFVSRVRCPYCHNSDANRTGACVHRAAWGYCTEDYYPEHNNKATCRWCRGTGEMSGLEGLLD